MDKCVVRRAIKDAATDQVTAYELFFQSGEDGLYEQQENVVVDTIAEFFLNNSSKIFSDKKIFVTLTPSLLFRNTARFFQKDKVVIQIEDNVIIHPLAMPIIKKYYKEGYTFAINDFQFTPKYFGFLDYADYIRIKVSEEPTEKEYKSLENIIHMAEGMGKKCVATDLDTAKAYNTALELGVDYLEGGYIAETLITKADKVTYMEGNFFQLVVAVAKDEPDMEEIEDIVSRDAGLTYAILKLVNSAYFALRKRTASIRQALMTLGIGQLRQWVYMLSFQKEQTSGTEEMLKLSFLRATFAQILVPDISECPITKPEAYMMGMFSTLEYMVDAPLEELLAEIPVRDEIKEALLKGTGVAGKLQRLVICYEKADWKHCKELAIELGIDVNQLSQIYINCVEEVNSIWDNLVNEYNRPGESRSFSELKEDKEDEEHIEDAFK